MLCLVSGVLTEVAEHSASAQQTVYVISARNGETRVREKTLLTDLEMLLSAECDGRRPGSKGAQAASRELTSRFKALGFQPLGEYYAHSFPIKEGGTGRNVVGIIPGSGKGYVVVGAHYDGIGNFGGTVYPGADSNASGVAALLSLGEAIHHMNKLGRNFSRGIIFVAFDANTLNMAGSKAFADELAAGSLVDPIKDEPIGPSDITAMVNLDQLGSTLAPLSTREDYLIMLSDESDSSARSAFSGANREDGLSLELGFDYYGSKDFTRLFFRRICDQKAFLDLGIRSVMFTSGITMNNNKPSDTLATLSLPLLRRRTILIYYWLLRIL